MKKMNVVSCPSVIKGRPFQGVFYFYVYAVCRAIVVVSQHKSCSSMVHFFYFLYIVGRCCCYSRLLFHQCGGRTRKMMHIKGRGEQLLCMSLAHM